MAVEGLEILSLHFEVSCFLLGWLCVGGRGEAMSLFWNDKGGKKKINMDYFSYGNSSLGFRADVV